MVYRIVMRRYLIGKVPKHQKKQLVILFLLIILTIFSGIALSKKSSEKQPAKNDVITYSTNQPDEKKPNKNTYKWVGDASEPKYITLPSIGAEGFVQNVGLDQNNQIAVPYNVHMAAWFTGSAKLGDEGLSIIDGHVDGLTTKEAIFAKLGRLQIGDVFWVELGSGKKLSYKVLSVSTVDVSDAAKILFSQDPKNASQLNLITCGGRFDTKAHAYDERVIVSAALQ